MPAAGRFRSAALFSRKRFEELPMTKRILHWCDEYAEKYLLAVGLLLIIHIVFLQTFYRYIIGGLFPDAASLSWTEELSRSLCVWITYLALPLCVKYKTNIRITVIYDNLPKWFQPVIDNLSSFVFMILAGLIVSKGWEHIQMVNEFKQYTPMMGIPQGVLYLILPVAFSLTILRLCIEVAKSIKTHGLLKALLSGVLIALIFTPALSAGGEGNAAAYMFGYFLTFAMISVPLGVAIGLACMATILGCDTLPIEYIASTTYTAIDSFALMAIPFFLAAGTFMAGGGLSSRLVGLADQLLGKYYGGMAMASVATCMFFAAICGSGPATVAAIGCITIPAMVERGYDRVFSTAIVASAGIIGVIIPPSNPLLMYGISAQESIVKLFAGGILPGLVCGAALMLVAYFISRKHGWKGDPESVSSRNLRAAVWEAKWALAVPVIILGGIYGGIMTPTEAAAVAAFYGFYVGIFVYKGINRKNLLENLTEPVITYASINLVFAMATVFGQLLTIEQIPQIITQAITSLTENKWVVLLLLNLLLLVVGTFMEPLSAIIILTPILLPIAQAVGIDLVHFGVLITVNLAIGFLTPPIGMNLFVGSQIGDVSMESLSKGVLPFLAALLVVLLIVNVVPQLTLFLPELMSR